jgi:hypothetical protein
MMSLKTGTRIRTYKPVVYKPSENALVASDKNNDRKFMFLSEETKPGKKSHFYKFGSNKTLS